MSRFIVASIGMAWFFLPVIGYSGGLGDRAVPVQVVEVAYVELAPTILVAGTVISRHDANIATEVEGRIESLLEMGARVSQGELIAKIDDTKIHIQLEEIKADIMATEARVQFLKRETDRLGELSKHHHVAKSELDKTMSERDTMIAELAMKQARWLQAKDTLARTAILAPFSGVIVERFKQMGEYAETGKALVRLVDVAAKEIQGRVPQGSGGLIKKGQSMWVTDGVVEHLATVTALIPFSDNASRLYELRLAYDEPQWLAGHAVRIQVPTADPVTTLAVPRDALVIRGDAIRVFRILENNIAAAVLVDIGVASGALVEIIGDIHEGDKVVVRGNERLRPQQKVRLQAGP